MTTDLNGIIERYYHLRQKVLTAEAHTRIQLAGTVSAETLESHVRLELEKDEAELLKDYEEIVILYEQAHANLREREVVAHEQLADFYQAVREAQN